MIPELPIDDEEAVPFEVDEQAFFADIAGTAETRDGARESTVDSIRPAAEPTAAPEPIKIDKCDRLSLAADREGFALRAAAIVSAILAAFGLAWIIAGALSSGRNSGSQEPIVQASNPSSPDTGSSKGNRLDAPPIAAAAKRKTGDQGSIDPQERQKLAPATSGARKRSVAAVPASVPSPSRRLPAVPQHTASVEVPAEETDVPKMPVPETKPTTIDGWTVRDVANGTAVLEGPNGLLRVAAGNTVPALGRIESIVRWGNRWIVATSSGLITTP